ncbi:unnamed protein product [Phytophthora fragariaefolia]|uniref:Unnamed protein product n=1 Tax=Phytophthora fragariaefolia TaxID=1490495 RepID=A0A9W7CJ71_9STRA|nr:unnamed protein product [Phytophthora fragariaefolia]
MPRRRSQSERAESTLVSNHESCFAGFCAIGTATAAKTTFGQSSGFGSQPPLPPGGLAGAPGAAFGNQPPLPPGGLAGAPPPPSGGFGAAATSGNPFGQKKTSQNKAQGNTNTAFGGTAFGRNGVSPSANSMGAHTTFGSASSGGGKPKSRGSAFGGNAVKTSFGGNGSSSFGETNAAFGGKDNGFGGGQAAFGTPTPKRGRNSFSYDSSGFGSGSAAGPTPLSSPGTSFGSQASGVKVRKKQITPNAAGSRSDNPFAAGGGTSTAPATNTTFGGGTSTSSFQASPTFSKGGPASATTFGGAADKRRQSTPKFGSDAAAGGFTNPDKMASMEARMNGSKRSPLGQGKRAQGFGASTEQDANPFGGRQSKVSQKFPSDGTAFGTSKVPKTSPTNEKHPKQRQNRPKKKAAVSIEDATPAAPMPTTVSSRDESSKAELSAAINLDGLCADMCSPAERELHIRVDELSVFEKCFPDQPGTERDMIIKRFQRSSADHKLDIPEEIRPPGVLRRTQLYIEQAIMDLDQCGLDPRFQPPRAPEAIELYNFCWDRFRMIRKDFVLQNYRGAGGRVHPIALDIHERIARYHVLSEHELIETPSFVAQQNVEQLGQTLKSLNELYDESHKVGDPAYLSPFESECRAYFILCTLDNGRGMDVLKYVKNLPRHVMESPHMKFAMRVFVARHTGDYFQFFSLLRQATYLQSCLLFRYIPNVRSSALLRMNRAYRSQTYPLEDLVELLCFDDIEHAYSVCKEHQLRISGRPGGGDDSAIVVKFGGDFETGKTPRTRTLNYLRRDICRGVTEYARDEYPALSKLIQDSEREEQARLYSDRPGYDDDYSYFVDYNEGMPTAPPSSASHASGRTSVAFSNAQDDIHQKIDMIAQKKMQLEQKKEAMLQKMRQLEQAKEEKALQDKAKKAAVELAAQREEKAMKEAIARAQAEKEAAEAKRQQEVLEAKLCEEKKRRELEEQRRRAEEATREAERQRIVAQQQAEALRMKAAEEERRRQEEKRQEELRRKAAEEREQRHQQELAEARARQAREAALEAQRQAQLAKEREERKRIRRAAKQKHAVLKLRLHMWKKYVHVSRNGFGPVAIDASKFRLDRPHQKAKDSVQWLFREADGTIGTPIGTKRVKRVASTEVVLPSSDAEILSLWRSEDILGLVGDSLRQQNPGAPSIAWKLVIADLLDGTSSSFGLWCAVRAGTQNAATPEPDCYRTFQSSNDMKQGVAVCCRYLDSTFTQRNHHEMQTEKLAATSAILLPVDLSALQCGGNCSNWEQRVGELLSSLKVGCRVTVLALGFASAEVKSSRALLMSTLGSWAERVQNRFSSRVIHVGVEFVDAGNLLPQKFGQTLTQIATLTPPVRNLKSVGLKELLEGSVKAMINQYESSMVLQGSICAVFPRVRKDILSSGVMDLTYPPPELQYAVMDPPQVETSTVQRDQTCDVYFRKVENFIDQLFLSYPASTAVSTYELKKRIYSALLPVHQRLVQDGSAEPVTPQEADALLPWRKIFEEIYETFFETLSDIAIYYPADWRGFGSSVARLLEAVNTSAPRQLLEANSSDSKCDHHIVAKKPVQVFMQSIRRTFGSLTAVDESLQEYRAVGEMKRLRVEIEKERAATSQFQRMLRQALNRWDD